MNLNRPLRTDRRLWLACAAVAFVPLGFVSIQSEAVAYKVGPTHLWGMFGQREYLVGVPLLFLACYSAILAGASAVFGWVAQAMIVVVRDGRRKISRKSHDQPN